MCEIGEQIGYTGQVKEVKILGIMALIEGDQTDWKVIVVDVNDPFSHGLNDIEDVELHLPGILRATNEWFRVHEIPDGKMEKFFAFTGECKNKEYCVSYDLFVFNSPLANTLSSLCRYTTQIIEQCHGSWQRLILGITSADNFSLYVPHMMQDGITSETNQDLCSANTSVRASPFYLRPEQLPEIKEDEDLPPAETKSSIDKWFFFRPEKVLRPGDSSTI